MSEWLSLTKVCKELDIVTDTLQTWYKWWNDKTEEKPDDCPGLPHRIREGERLFWLARDLPQLRAFKEWVPKGRAGVMGKYNRMRWKHNESNRKRES